MKNRLPLLRHYIGAVRNTLPYSYLIDWADEQLLQGHYDDNIIALACATTHEQAIAAAENLLGTRSVSATHGSIHPNRRFVRRSRYHRISSG